MADDPVVKIYGIGKVISEALRNHQITTVGQLAELEPGEISIANLSTLIHRAKEHIQTRKGLQTSEEKRVVLDGGGSSISSAKKDGLFKISKKVETKKEATSEAKEEPTEEQKDQYMISDHTWFETKIVVPTQDSLQEAIVYELGVEPNDRIAFVCTWVTDNKFYTMTYSPQLILHFNLELPPLRVSIREEDLKALPNQHALTNALWEVEMMQKQMHE